MIEKLQYITQETETLSHIDCVREACISDIKWIQLRVKNKSDKEYLIIAQEAKIICDLYDVKLIINDNVDIVKQVNAHGVHLGKNDMNPEDARTILGKKAIIGATANTIEDVQKLINLNINYIGLGPYKTTSTKKDLAPVLGINGYFDFSQKIFELLKNSKLNYSIPPIVAIGGIQQEDISQLMKTGIYGIAVSAAITNNFSLINTFNDELKKPVPFLNLDNG